MSQNHSPRTHPRATPKAAVRMAFLGAFALGAAFFCLGPNLAESTPAATMELEPIDGQASTRADGNRIYVDLRLGDHHRFGSTLPRRAVRETDDGLVIYRAAGTVAIYARLGDSGRFVFTPDHVFHEELAQRGLLPATDQAEAMFELAMVDVTLDFIDGLAELGYRENLHRLIEMRVHDADPRYVRDLQDVGLADLSAHRLVEMRIHGVRADDVRAWQRLELGDLSPQRLVEMAIHGVTPEYVESLHGLGLEDLSARRLVEMRIHGVDPDFVRDMTDLGYTDVPVHRWVEMRIHGVDGDYVRRLAEKGETGLSVRELIERRIHGR